MNLKGIYVPIITPFQKNNINEIDEKMLRVLVNKMIGEQKVSGIVPCGTTGESPTLSHDEHKKVIQIVIDEVKGRVPVIAGTGSNSTIEAIEMTKSAEDFGVEASLQVVPYYNKPSQKGLLNHFEKIAKNTNLPIILYDIPTRSGINIDLETYKELTKIDNIIGVKIAPKQFEDVAELLAYIYQNNIKNFNVLAGDDPSTFSMLALGAKGGITAAAHIVGYEYQQMCEAAFNNDFNKAKEIHFKTLNAVKLMFCEPNPAPIKYALSLMELDVNYLREPLISISQNSQNLIKNELKKLSKI